MEGKEYRTSEKERERRRREHEARRERRRKRERESGWKFYQEHMEREREQDGRDGAARMERERERWAWASRNYRKLHPEKRQAARRRRRARKLGAPGSHTAADVAILRGISGGFCQGWKKAPHYVGAGRLTVDHIIPLSRGGGDGADNLQMLCSSCNSSKGTEVRQTEPGESIYSSIPFG